MLAGSLELVDYTEPEPSRSACGGTSGEVFEVRTKQVNSKDIVQTFLAEVMDLWYTSYIRSHSIRG